MAESRYIAIEGPIGVGKTGLARRLAEALDSELVLEEAGANPFLERFYHDPRAAALPTQLFFLFQRVAQLERLRQADMFSDLRVSDFLIDKDRLFAQTTLDRHELSLYERVYETLDFDPPIPDLVVYLQAPVDTLLFRIARRGIAYEKEIGRRYLERLAEAYSRFFTITLTQLCLSSMRRISIRSIMIRISECCWMRSRVHGAGDDFLTPLHRRSHEAGSPRCFRLNRCTSNSNSAACPNRRSMFRP